MRRIRVAMMMVAVAVAIAGGWSAVAEEMVIRIWPDAPPGAEPALPAEADVTKPGDGQVAGRRVMRIGNVSTPTLSIRRPTGGDHATACVLVCPGGGYNILARDLEGTEVCDWLDSMGVTTALLSYRVPRRAGREPWAAPLEDAQRSIRILRHRAAELGIDPGKIGCLGFSAGGNLCGLVATRHGEAAPPPVDAADDASSRPDFTILVYPAYMVDESDRSRPAAPLRWGPDSPPTFITMAEDDVLGCDNALVTALELSRHKVPISLHLYPTGGHGYGLRDTGDPSGTWPDRAAEWLRHRGLVAPRSSD